MSSSLISEKRKDSRVKKSSDGRFSTELVLGIVFFLFAARASIDRLRVLCRTELLEERKVLFQ
jgi:hypothetical protein